MENEGQIALASTLHDPQGRMAPIVADCLSLLTQLYQYMAVVATPQTAAETLALLRRAGADVWDDGDDQIGKNRRRALAAGVEKERTAYFHYCDFDRLLHWALHEPQELERVATRALQRADYTAIGRTEAAFATHPPVQQELEGMTNDLFSFLVGERMDVTAGSAGASRAAARALLQHSVEMSNATDAEWPMIIRQHTQLSLQQIRVRGLAFETATFHGSGVYESAHTADNWAQRARLARESMAAAMRVAREKPENGGARHARA